MSELRSRLGILMSQSGTMGSDPLANGWQRIGAGRRRRSPRLKRISDEMLASRLGGSVLCDGVVVIRERFAIDASHGDFPLIDRGLHEALSLCAAFEGNKRRACVFMDTETTGLAGGTGTLVFLLGMARFSGGTLEVSQLFLTGFQGESTLLEEAREFLGGADTLITYNGRSFDGPLLAARYRLSGLSDPFATLQHVDLLHVTRRTFNKCWSDCRLKTVERRLLGLERVGDLPGSEAPQAWFDWVRHGRDDRLLAVCSHNRLDLLSLAVLPAALQRSHDDPIASSANVLACARHRRNGLDGEDGDRASFEYLRCYRERLDVEGLLELARLARRRREWDLAVELWGKLAADGEAVAIEHLAKYYEHEERDFERALEFTGKLMACVPHNQHHHRRDARLRARLGLRQC